MTVSCREPISLYYILQFKLLINNKISKYVYYIFITFFMKAIE